MDASFSSRSGPMHLMHPSGTKASNHEIEESRHLHGALQRDKQTRVFQGRAGQEQKSEKQSPGCLCGCREYQRADSGRWLPSEGPTLGAELST